MPVRLTTALTLGSLMGAQAFITPMPGKVNTVVVSLPGLKRSFHIMVVCYHEKPLLSFHALFIYNEDPTSEVWG